MEILSRIVIFMLLIALVLLWVAQESFTALEQQKKELLQQEAFQQVQLETQRRNQIR